VIRHEIEQTRESLTEKIKNLEEQAKETIQDVKNTVENTVDTVKERVQDTVDTISHQVEGTVAAVKRTFDIPYQVQQHPLAMAGCSLLAGVATGYFLAGRRSYFPAPSYRAAARPDIQGFAAAPAAAPAAAAPSGPGLLGSLMKQFEPEIEKVKQVAIGALLGMARDYIRQAVPPNLAPHLTEVIDNVTRKAGGQPVAGPILPQEPSSPGSSRMGGNH